MSLKVKYLGLELDNPVIVASSPFTASVDKIIQLEQHGAGAAVLKSVFEEQIMGEAAYLERYNDHPQARDYLRGYIGGDYIAGHLNMISEAKKQVRMPLIASINCQHSGSWIDYAKSIEDAGADALELNIFFLPTSADEKSEEVEERYLDIVSGVAEKLTIPVSVKLGVRFTNVLSICRGIYYRGGKGVVMFNRFFEPDIDVDTMSVTGSDVLSSQSELRNNLRWVAMASAEVPTMDIAVTTGVHTGEDAVKSILSGAKAVEVCSTLYANGLDAIGQMKDYIAKWMYDHNFESIADFSGKLNYKGVDEPEIFQRAQFMKFFPKG
ncbi:dihydroorotate dehydrogenase-like protein [Alistipes sp. OttesenSCG-928-B03]|nr:dihydroorotate dehydrogenase-like protein [Alistipes sp. OttesenSCG-928-B03]